MSPVAAQALRFAVVGCANVMVSLGVFLLLLWVFETMPPWRLPPAATANALSWVAGLANSFVWNSLWTFRVESLSVGPLPRFLILNLGAATFSSAMIWLLVDRLALAQTPSFLAVTALTAAGNYFINRAWVFRKTGL
jgi:putative flippase GtrA